ncbi:flavin reductase [Bailinhaonella thermotolerans]|uniref:Flavin reductase n=2 Tax=Bailinhaonella thermotolerans TaxID=1070861 RepID=A0A3A4AAH7_9ACTN|nr:flavin reductase [Bailinhaonella thermotolerans]
MNGTAGDEPVPGPASVSPGGTGGGPPDGFVESMAQLAAGVGVVCVRDGRDDLGVTVTALTSISLDPPLFMVSLATASYVSEVLDRVDRWAVSLLGGSQATIASRFASKGRPGARLLLAGTPHHRGAASEALIVEGGVAALECETVQRVTAGDHTLFIARVLAVPYVEDTRPPLLRLRSRYRALS